MVIPYYALLHMQSFNFTNRSSNCDWLLFKFSSPECLIELQSTHLSNCCFSFRLMNEAKQLIYKNKSVYDLT